MGSVQRHGSCTLERAPSHRVIQWCGHAPIGRAKAIPGRRPSVFDISAVLCPISRTRIRAGAWFGKLLLIALRRRSSGVYRRSPVMAFRSPHVGIGPSIMLARRRSIRKVQAGHLADHLIVGAEIRSVPLSGEGWVSPFECCRVCGASRTVAHGTLTLSYSSRVSEVRRQFLMANRRDPNWRTARTG